MNIKNIIALEEVTLDLKRFPYGIYYEISDDIVIIVAILDLRQNPKNISAFVANRTNKN